MEPEKKACPTSVADIEGKLEDIIKFLEYEEAMTVDTRSQQRIAAKLKELGVWQTD